MNTKGKTKDTAKSREELNRFCRRPELEANEQTGKYPKACYMLDNDEKRILLKWIEGLRFPDGYVSSLGRCVNLSTLQMFGMKSHDCHVMMQRVLPVALKDLLPFNVWKTITDLCLFFKDLTSPNIQVDNLLQMQKNIPVILCKLERIFPPSFFDSMEHLPIHLADEAMMAGPVQYRWMYPFERYLGKLKKTVKNKAKVEGSITNAYLVEEATAFCCYYFEDHVKTKQRNVPRNFEGSGVDVIPDMLSVFKYVGRPFGKMTTRFLEPKEHAAAHLYVLNNCTEVTETYTGLFEDEMRAKFRDISSNELQQKLEKEFPTWFKAYASNPTNGLVNSFLHHLSLGPLHRVTTYQGFFVNGFKFHTVSYGSKKSTDNSGLCVKGSVLNGVQLDFYGRLLEVVVLEYPGLPIKTTTLFKCEWFDPQTPTGTDIDRDFNLVSVHKNRRYSKYEPFILANQAAQVYYCLYPSKNNNRSNWLAACKVKARPVVEVSTTELPTTSLPFQEEVVGRISLTNIDDISTMVHPHGGEVDIDHDDDDDEDDEDLILQSPESSNTESD
ncbi:uncharacterized protein LOC131000215 isoform X1 [Salvia miltiorrhiza]|uniref:uncharacterized protein LOC131000215 isoform X1 n=1 Tax=Salvia miltiorrhiza TaxID=226208 RepID=UPI0025ACD7CD|nr:uncharacterized protein LOC131000215 isoform X1 [Salvia miltiorrhiza]